MLPTGIRPRSPARQPQNRQNAYQQSPPGEPPKPPPPIHPTSHTTTRTARRERNFPAPCFPLRVDGCFHQIVWLKNPPSTRKSIPVTKLAAAGLAKNTHAPTNSCASPKRFIGVCPQIACVRAVGVPSS